MATHISATELVRSLGDVLSRIRYRGESFLVERNGAPVARLEPAAGTAPSTLGSALAAWRAITMPDPAFAEDLARVNAADQPPASPWDS
jgi:antitoxin (DNA-binding transcriptional repressor) of toxin-antitoxin stability system